MKKLNWKLVWEQFDQWASSREDNKRCKTCGESTTDFPEWGEQQKKIQQLVDKQLRG